MSLFLTPRPVSSQIWLRHPFQSVPLIIDTAWSHSYWNDNMQERAKNAVQDDTLARLLFDSRALSDSMDHT